MIRNYITAAIAAETEGCFRRGFAAGDDVLHFAASTLGLNSIEEISAMLADEDSYGEGLIDLVFAPPRDLQLSLEPIIPSDGIGEEEEEDVVRRLRAGYLSVDVFLGKTRYHSRLTLTGSIIRDFVIRLYLQRPVPHALAVPAGSPHSGQYCLSRLMMRRAGYAGTAERDTFLCRLIETELSGSGPGGSALPESLDFMLKLFDEEPAGDDFFRMISGKKHFAMDALRRLAGYRDLARGHSMDYLMSQRVTPPAVDEEEMRRTILTADRICLSMFGAAAPLPPAETEAVLEMDRFDGGNLSEVIEFLS